MSIRSRLRLLRAMLLPALPAVAASCGITDPGEPGLRAEIESHRARWESRTFRDYRARIERECFCPPAARGPVRVEVRRGEVVRVLDPGSGEPVDEELVHLFPSVDGLFVVLLEAVARDAHRVEVEWNDELGYPTRAFIDYEAQTADEELGFRVGEVEALE